MDSLPEISLGTAALIIFGVCGAYVLLRGLLRALVNIVILAVSAWAGYLVWQRSPALADEWFQTTSSLITTGLPIATFVICFLVLRWTAKLFRAPSRSHGEETESPTLGQVVIRLLMTAVPATLLCLIVAALIHHVTSVAEIKDYVKDTTETHEAPSLAARLKKSLESAIPSSLMDKIDPLTSQQRLKLAKMIAANADESLEPAIDPDTGKPIPRAIVVDSPELESLAREGRFSTLLRHPALTKALEDPEVRASLGL